MRVSLRAVLFFSAFFAASLQFAASIQKLKRWRKVVPLAISLLTLTLSYIIMEGSTSYGSGMIPFESGFGLLAFSVMCSIGFAIGLCSWLCWYLLFYKATLSQRGRKISCGIVIGLYLVTALFIYWITA